jgi:hypothetical protein
MIDGLGELMRILCTTPGVPEDLDTPRQTRPARQTWSRETQNRATVAFVEDISILNALQRAATRVGRRQTVQCRRNTSIVDDAARKKTIDLGSFLLARSPNVGRRDPDARSPTGECQPSNLSVRRHISGHFAKHSARTQQEASTLRAPYRRRAFKGRALLLKPVQIAAGVIHLGPVGLLVVSVHVVLSLLETIAKTLFAGLRLGTTSLNQFRQRILNVAHQRFEGD